MKKSIDLKNLPCIADEMLSGLTAGERLRHRILNESKGQGPARAPWLRRVMTFAPAGLAVVLLMGISVLVAGQIGLSGPPADVVIAQGDGTQVIDSYPAGKATQPPEGALLAYAEVPDDSIQIGGASGEGGEILNLENPPVDDQNQVYLPEETDIPTEAPVDLPSFHSNFASGEGANFPLIGLSGNAYRQTYVSLSDNGIGSSLGTVALYTSEPALAENADWNNVLSNICAEGSEVYEVSGLPSGTAVAGRVEGTLYLFQRVSFSGHGTGGQSLESTLGVRGNVSSLTLSGVGRIDDSAKANALISLLLDGASFNSDEMLRGQQSLDIHLKNGTTLQLMISDGVFSACGSWICTEFFDQYQSML